ncbi:MAG TPA: thioesterase family protein [Orrella sp.]
MTIDRSLAPGDVFEVDLPMRWADADMLQHLNNAGYFRFMEEARIRMLAAAGLKADGSVGNVVAHCACDFLRPITYPATVRVKLVVERIGRTSLTQINDIYVVEDLAFGPYARGKTVLVSMHNATGKPTPWTPEALAALGQVCHAAV